MPRVCTKEQKGDYIDPSYELCLSRPYVGLIHVGLVIRVGECYMYTLLKHFVARIPEIKFTKDGTPNINFLNDTLSLHFFLINTILYLEVYVSDVIDLRQISKCNYAPWLN